MSPSRRAYGSPHLVLLTFCTILAVLWLILRGVSAPSSGIPDRSGAKELRGVQDFIVLGSGERVEFVYQMPATLSPIGVLLFAHGCSHAATDWWPHDTTLCPECIGLPVEVTLVRAALRRGVLPVAVSSADRDSGCWTVADTPRVVAVLMNLRSRFGLPESVPTWGWGASSGGSFVASLGEYTRRVGGSVVLAAVVVQIMVPPEPTASSPPALFVHMPRDERMAHFLRIVLGQYAKLGIDAAELMCEPKPVTANFFEEHGALDTRASREAATALLRAGTLDSNTLQLLRDPRSPRSSWREVVRPHVPPADSLVADHSPVSEIMNVAFARHEITDEHLDSSFKFLGQYVG